MFKNILPLVLLTMIIVSACETQNPENPEKEETIKLKKILVKDQGYIEFNYDGNQVSEMNYTFPSGKTPVYAEFEFRYENDELYEITRTIYPDSITSYPSSKFRYTFDFSDSEVDLTTNYDARTSTINEETTWDFDAEGKLIHQKWDNRNYWDYTDFEWEDGNLIQTQTFRTDIPDSLFRLDTYQYDKQMSYSSLFPKEFLLAMCWILGDFYFDEFEDAVLSVNNCIHKREEFIHENPWLELKDYSYIYHENGFPETIQVDYERFDDDDLDFSSTTYYTLEYDSI